MDRRRRVADGEVADKRRESEHSNLPQFHVDTRGGEWQQHDLRAEEAQGIGDKLHAKRQMAMPTPLMYGHKLQMLMPQTHKPLQLPLSHHFLHYAYPYDSNNNKTNKDNLYNITHRETSTPMDIDHFWLSIPLKTINEDSVVPNIYNIHTNNIQNTL